MNGVYTLYARIYCTCAKQCYHIVYTIRMGHQNTQKYGGKKLFNVGNVTVTVKRKQTKSNQMLDLENQEWDGGTNSLHTTGALIHDLNLIRLVQCTWNIINPPRPQGYSSRQVYLFVSSVCLCILSLLTWLLRYSMNSLHTTSSFKGGRFKC